MSRFSQKSRDWLDTPAHKRAFNAAHFAAAAARYDVATIAMSFGRDRGWKRRLVAELPLLQRPCCLDLACGTGDLSRLLADRYPHGRIIGLDLTREMVRVSRGVFPRRCRGIHRLRSSSAPAPRRSGRNFSR